MTKLTNKLPTIARITLGLAFFVFGLNGFLHFLPQPPAPAAAANLIGAMIGSGYLLAFVKATEVVVGALLLLNRFVPLALTVLAPVMVNIIAFHAFLAPAGLALPIVLVSLQLYLAWAYREAFAPMLQARTAPSEELAPIVATVR
jgi:uncharacterized membrane protein YphA (DoxX/SURF4 family)